MTLIKIIKEKVWREKVNKAIHTSSGRDTGVGREKSPFRVVNGEIFMSQLVCCFLGSQLLPLPPWAWLYPLMGLGLVWRPLIISCASFLP